MTTFQIMAAILVSALCTFTLRALPFLVFRGTRKMPEWLENLGAALPPAIMAVLIIYCLKDAGTDWTGIGIPKLLAVAIVVITYKIRHSTLLSILAGTSGYMILLRIL